MLQISFDIFILHFKLQRQSEFIHLNEHNDHILYKQCNYLDRNPTTGIKIGGVLSGLGMHYQAGVICHNIITVTDKSIWNVNYATNICDRKFAEKYLKRCSEILKQACFQLR